MKVAVFSESSADEAAIRILADGILGAETEPVPLPRLQSRGWPSVLHVLPKVVMHLHYQTDADALVVVVDSNCSPVHDAEEDQPCIAPDRCRLCRLRAAVERVRGKLTPVPGREMVKVAIGLAVPAMEAWYLCGVESGVSEAAWRNGQRQGVYPYSRRKLKRDVYGTSHPSLALETERAVEEVRRLVLDLRRLEERYPIGFGALAEDVRGW